MEQQNAVMAGSSQVPAAPAKAPAPPTVGPAGSGDLTQPPTGPLSVGRDFSYAGAIAGTTIGPYRVLQTIGEGGMGTIYKAEQRQPIRRVVALKLVKLGMDTRAVIARFDAERQALSLMDHPNIAKALDAGATETGRPYFVMEYVAGVPITQYCNHKKLPTRERLELFIQVCDAIQHAHHKGIIHRDLKPNNVLVAEHDGRPVPKVIDFGVAKAIHGRLTDATLATEIGGVLGTLGYMSPEQAELSGLDVDSRTDVYSLGILLYELLVGEPPFDPETLRRAAFTEAQRIIREEDPPRPSTKLTTKLPPAGAKIAPSERELMTQLGTDLDKRIHALRGELDWIPLKALRKDRNERYSTPAELAQDVHRYLDGEPIQAYPPSAAYRARKLLRRHRKPALAAAIVLATLVLGIAGTSWFALEARREARRAADAEEAALEREREADAQRLEAERQKRIAEETSSFLLWMFQRADPVATQGQEISAADLIARSINHLEERFQEQPQVRTSLQFTLGRALFNLGRPREAEPLLRQALDGQRKLLGADDPATVQTITSLARVLAAMGKPEAPELQRQVWTMREAKLGRNHADTIDSMNDTGVALMMLGKFAEAEAVFRDMASRSQSLAADHPHRAGSQLNLGIALQSQGKPQEAEQLLRQTLAEMERILGSDHNITYNCRTALARTLIDQRRFDEATPLAEAALSGLRGRLGPGHFFTKEAAATMVLLYEATGRKAEADQVRKDYGLRGP